MRHEIHVTAQVYLPLSLSKSMVSGVFEVKGRTQFAVPPWRVDRIPNEWIGIGVSVLSEHFWKILDPSLLVVYVHRCTSRYASEV